MHSCTNCDYITTRKSDLERHRRCIHHINVIWYKCSHCDFKTKRKDSLKAHLAFKHEIGVIWFKCLEEGCNHQAKQKGDLKRHMEFVHDIGEHQCDFCCSMRNSRNTYTDEHGTHNICNKCYSKATGQQSRKETLWSNYLDTHLEFPATSSDKSLKSIGGCILQRPDKLYTSQTYTEIGECDEFEHLNKNSHYSCDEKRITKIYDEEGIMGTHLNVLRWNPDGFKAPRGVTKPSLKEKNGNLCGFIPKIA